MAIKNTYYYHYNYNNSNNKYNTNPPVTSQHINYAWTQLEQEPLSPTPTSPSPPLQLSAPTLLVTPAASIWPSSYCDERAGGMYAMQHLRFPTPPITPPRSFTSNIVTTGAIFPTAKAAYIVTQQQIEQQQQQHQHQQQQHITSIPAPVVVPRTQSVIMKIPSAVAVDNVLHSSSSSSCTSSTCSASSSGRESTSPSTSNNSNSDYLCEWLNCNRYFENLDALAAHVTQIHAVADPTDGLYYCRWRDCQRSDRGFNARYKMLVHARTHTKEKPHTCQLCGKSFSRAENLKIHIRSHSGEKPYVCIYAGCNKSYSNSSDRFKHTRTHAVEKPYVCKLPGCHKRYTDPSSLRKHVKTFRHVIQLVDNDNGNTTTTITQAQLPPSPPSPPTPEHYTHFTIAAEAETELNQTNALYHSAVGVSNSSGYWPYAYSSAPNVDVVQHTNTTMELDVDVDVTAVAAESIVPLDLRVHRR